jgi:hypothetical protein
MGLAVLLWCAIAVVGYFLGLTKGRATAGLWLALLIGPIGWIAILLGPDYRNKNKYYDSTGSTIGKRMILKSKSPIAKN